MGTTTEELQLVVTTQDAEKLDAVEKKLDRLRDAKGRFVSAGNRDERAVSDVYELADAYEVLGEEQRSVFTSAVQVGRAMDPVEHAMAEVGQKAELAARGIKEVGAASDRASSGMSDWQQRIQAGSFAFQDFTSTTGDLGQKLNSITNNIPQLLVGLGGIGTAIGIAATAGVALYNNWDVISSLWETRHPIPEVANDLDSLTREVKKNEEALDKLREKTALNYDELKRYQELTRKQVELEERQAQARETEANRKAHGALSNEAARTRASGFGKALDEAGGFDAVVEGFVKSDAITGAITDPRQVESIRRAWQKTFNDALKGDAGAINTVTTSARLDRTGLTRMMDVLVKIESPEQQAAFRKAEEEKRKGEEESKRARTKAADDARKAREQETIAAIDRENKAEESSIAEAQRAAADETKAANRPDKVNAFEARAQHVKDARVNSLARQIFRQSRRRTGVQFSPDQAREAARQSIALQQEGLSVNEATFAAMKQGLDAMRAMVQRMARLRQEAAMLRNGFGQVGRQVVEMQPTALNFGGGGF